MDPGDHKRGIEVLKDAALNKGTAFTRAERDELGLRGLLPAAVCSQQTQMTRVLENLRRKAYDIERYIFLMALAQRNERLFYRMVIEHIDELLPLIYTPTVGQACKEFAHIYRDPRAFYVTPRDRGCIRDLVDNWPARDVRLVVVTDGERILGLGDLGANGVGIPIGKAALYSACAGIPPSQCMPVLLDVGTDNDELRSDPLYLGESHARVRGEAYDALVEELLTALVDAHPRALIQFEDFKTPNAWMLLRRYRHRLTCFNDDIQGTAAVALGGLYSSTRISGMALEDLRFMFLGAGSAATGIADLLVRALVSQGLEERAARERIWFADIEGLVVSSRDDLAPHNLQYAHDHAFMAFKEALRRLRPHVLIGATGAPGTFDEQVVRTMSEQHERPVIFALSNPTDRAECTAKQAYAWSDGRAIFASGSPFGPVTLGARTFRPGQGNNAYVFPGLGLGVIHAEATEVTDEMLLEAARAVADMVSESQLEAGTLYPPLARIREVSLEIATRVAALAHDRGTARTERPSDLRASLAEAMYDPTY